MIIVRGNSKPFTWRAEPMPLRVLILLLSAGLAGCWEFVAPDLGAEAGVSVLQVSATLNADDRVQITGLLAPGIDEDGFRRRILNDTLGVFDIRFPPTAQRPSGTREYFRTDILDGARATLPFTVDPPQLEDIPLTPGVRWFGVRKLDEDTIRLARGADLILHLDTNLGESTPEPNARNWSLDLNGARGSFRLSGGGVPPAELIVPAVYLPVAFVEGGSNNVVQATLTYTQSIVIIAQNFRGNYAFTTRSTWTIQIQ